MKAFGLFRVLAAVIAAALVSAPHHSYAISAYIGSARDGFRAVANQGPRSSRRNWKKAFAGGRV